MLLRCSLPYSQKPTIFPYPVPDSPIPRPLTRLFIMLMLIFSSCVCQDYPDLTFLQSFQTKSCIITHQIEPCKRGWKQYDWSGKSIAAGTPYQMVLGVLELWRSEKGSKQTIMLPRKYWNNNGIPSGALCSDGSFCQQRQDGSRITTSRPTQRNSQNSHKLSSIEREAFQAPCFLYIGQAFRYSPENAFYIFNQLIYFII